MPKLRAVVVAASVCWAGFGRGIAFAQAQVVILPASNSSISLSAPQVSTDSGSLSVTATNGGANRIRSYEVSVFWFPRAGRHGFVTQVQRPSAALGTGESQQTNVVLGSRVSLNSETTLIVVLKGVSFDDGTGWSNDDVNAQVDQKARELNLP